MNEREKKGWNPNLGELMWPHKECRSITLHITSFKIHSDPEYYVGHSFSLNNTQMHEKDKMVITFIIPVKYETKHTEHICVTDRGITVELYMAYSTVSKHCMI